MRRHIPNLVTASRGLAGPVVATCAILGRLDIAFAVFVTAIFSDLFDGWLAHLLDARSELGQWLDPASDKLLMASSWIALLATDLAPAWLVVPILVRDVVVIGGWLYIARKGTRWQPSQLGQIMVSFEGVAVSVLLFPDRAWLGVHWLSVGVALGGITLALSAGSLAEYALKGPKEFPQPR